MIPSMAIDLNSGQFVRIDAFIGLFRYAPSEFPLYYRHPDVM